MSEQSTNRKSSRREVAARAARPDHMYSYCRVVGCSKPARAGTGDGLDQMYCRPHADHYQRHGSPVKGSYRAEEINPYRRAALRWLSSNPDDPYVVIALRNIEGLYQRGGPHIEAFRLQGLDARDRAWAAWARLRAHQIDPRLPVAAWLAVELLAQSGHVSAAEVEYKRVQGAKLVHRMASGSHKRWTVSIPDRAWSGLKRKEVPKKLDKYPHSRGRVLRYIGQDLETAAELLVEHHLDEIRRYVDAARTTDRNKKTPYVAGFVGRRRGG